MSSALCVEPYVLRVLMALCWAELAEMVVAWWYVQKGSL